MLDFYADWCGPCQSMAPTVESLARAGYAVRRINIDQQPDLARQYDVSAIPCFVVVQEGREIDRVTGMTTIERLKVKLQRRSAVRTVRSPQAAPIPPGDTSVPSGTIRQSCESGVSLPITSGP